MTDIDDRSRRARSYQFAGSAALVVALFAIFFISWIAGAAMALIGIGSLLAYRGVKAGGLVPTPAKVLMIVGGVAFVAVFVILFVNAVRG